LAIVWITPPKQYGISTTFLKSHGREKNFEQGLSPGKFSYQKLWGLKVPKTTGGTLIKNKKFSKFFFDLK